MKFESLGIQSGFKHSYAYAFRRKDLQQKERMSRKQQKQQQHMNFFLTKEDCSQWCETVTIYEERTAIFQRG